MVNRREHALDREGNRMIRVIILLLFVGVAVSQQHRRRSHSPIVRGRKHQRDNGFVFLFGEHCSDKIACRRRCCDNDVEFKLFQIVPTYDNTTNQMHRNTRRDTLRKKSINYHFIGVCVCVRVWLVARLINATKISFNKTFVLQG